MDLKSKRSLYHPDGIISNVFRPDGTQILVTLEHAYMVGAGFAAKVKPGVYTCVRGTHALSDGKPFETFEVTGVDGHTGILFHHGNFNEDSEGCILTGDAEARGPDPHGDGTLRDLVTNSNVAFQRFMAAQQGVDHFVLEVVA